MREIKFRGKVKYNGNNYFSGDWVKGYYCGGIKNKHYIKISIDNGLIARIDSIEIIPETVGQYTGRMDKNQKEIYKNDILKFVYDNLRFKGIVRYNKNKAQYIIYCEDGKFGFDIIQKVKVIGNNYENPELLE